MISSSSTKSLAPHISRTQKQIAAALLWIGGCAVVHYLSRSSIPLSLSAGNPL